MGYVKQDTIRPLMQNQCWYSTQPPQQKTNLLGIINFNEGLNEKQFQFIQDYRAIPSLDQKKQDRTKRISRPNFKTGRRLFINKKSTLVLCEREMFRPARLLTEGHEDQYKPTVWNRLLLPNGGPQ